MVKHDANWGTPRSHGVERLTGLDIEEIEAARGRIRDLVVRTPLVRLNIDDAPAEIYLKLENLQPTGSFKVRGAGNAVALLSAEERARGVFTTSAGNMAQALAWHARRLGIPCTVIVPDTAPGTKLAAIRRFGAKIIQLSWDEVWAIGVARRYPPLAGWTFVHPFADPAMMAGNGTIGLEILEDLLNADAVLIPFGGGGLAAGIATAIKAKRPRTRVYGCEPETAAPLAASFAKGTPAEVRRIPSFVDGIGTSSVLPEMWNLVRPLLEGSLVVSLKEIASAIRLLVERNRIVAEGAGGASVAAATAGKAGKGPVVCVVSGGNIDTAVLGKILRGEMP
jgi:threonine dehydratase